MSIALRIFQVFSLIACYMCEKCENYTNNRYYPTNHLGPLVSCETKVGWMNDPNGFCYFKKEYHLFYQHNPYSGVSAGTAHWGHAKSKDLIHWEHLPVAMYPDQWYDTDGVFSGSAHIENDTMYIFYTGNINYADQIPDHKQYQIMVISEDGEIFPKPADPIIMGTDRQPNIRDPKVWKHEDTWYMVLGNSFNNDTLGRVLLYASKDLYNWEEVAVIAQSDGYLGYMWECPDFFELDGYYVLLFSPQGVEPEGDKYKNLYATGYMTGHFDYKSLIFNVTRPFEEIDHGHDFYASQTTLNENGERISIAWFDMWKQNYLEGAYGFTGQTTMPRKLTIGHDGRLLQHPIEAINKAVGRKLYAGKGRGGTKVKLENNTGKVYIRASSKRDFILLIESDLANDTVKIAYECEKNRVSLDRGGSDGLRRTKYEPTGDLEIYVYVDKSSTEVFTKDGELTMSSRFFPRGCVTVGIAKGYSAYKFSVNSMKRTVPLPCH